MRSKPMYSVYVSPGITMSWGLPCNRIWFQPATEPSCSSPHVRINHDNNLEYRHRQNIDVSHNKGPSVQQLACLERTEPRVRVAPATTATAVQLGTPSPSSCAANSAPASATTAGAWNFSVGPAHRRQGAQKSWDTSPNASTLRSSRGPPDAQVLQRHSNLHMS